MKPNNRGGKRKNAGRKPGVNKISYATKLPRWLVKWLRRQENQAVTIERALIKLYKLQQPEEKTWTKKA